MNKEYTFTIGDEVFYIASNEGDAIINSAVSMVNQHIKDSLSCAPSTSTKKAAIIAAVQSSHKFLQQEQEFSGACLKLISYIDSQLLL